jgi:hypothetical protein
VLNRAKIPNAKMVKVFVRLMLSILPVAGYCQAGNATLSLRLSGSAIDEGHYKPVAYITFYEFDSKCKQRQSDNIKLNKKIRSETKSVPVDKPVIVFVYYGDLRTRYGRSTSDYLVFQLESGKNYSLEISVEGSQVATVVHEHISETERKAIQVQRGYEYVKCG